MEPNPHNTDTTDRWPVRDLLGSTASGSRQCEVADLLLWVSDTCLMNPQNSLTTGRADSKVVR